MNENAATETASHPHVTILTLEIASSTEPYFLFLERILLKSVDLLMFSVLTPCAPEFQTISDFTIVALMNSHNEWIICPKSSQAEISKSRMIWNSTEFADHAGQPKLNICGIFPTQKPQ